MSAVTHALRCATAALALALSVAKPAAAETLERLGVKSFELTVDRNAVAVGDTLSVVIDVKMSKPVAQLDNMTLPQLYGFDVVGDERSCVASTATGSECTEQLKIAPTRPGVLTVGPAQLQALDAAGKPANYQSNYVTVRVVENPNAAASDDPFASMFGPLLRFLGLAVVVIVVVLVAFFAVLFVFARRLAVPGKTIPVAPPAPQPGPPPVDAEVRFAALVRALDAEPTRERALALRTELRYRIGAREEETLADLMRRRAGDDRALRLLAIVERAAFVQDAFVADAAREAVAQLRAMMTPSAPFAPPAGDRV